jgi:DNA (cytosine-5)-methyltransferase 1
VNKENDSPSVAEFVQIPHLHGEWEYDHPQSRMQQTVAEFFAGIGLMRMGLERAGWKVVWANDIDVDKKAIYEGHFKDGKEHFILGDVHQISGATVPCVSLATASFPCTDLSLAGARRGLAGHGSGAFWGFIQVIKSMGSCRPPMVLLENVTGFLTSHGGQDFRDACLALNELGYAVDAFIVDASKFVPQSRQRLFVVGHLPSNRSIVAETSPSFFEGPCRPAALAEFILWNNDINWDIRSLPIPPLCSKSLEDIVENHPKNSPLWWSEDRARYLLSQMSQKHREEAERMISARRITYGTVFRRVRHGQSMAELRTDGVAGCLRTPRGGSGRQILFMAGCGRYGVRLLTPRECARLMGADDFELLPGISPNQALFGFGDAVCVPVVEWIAENYLNPLAQELAEGTDAYRFRQKTQRNRKAVMARA